MKSLRSLIVIKSVVSARCPPYAHTVVLEGVKVAKGGDVLKIKLNSCVVGF